MCVSVYMYGGDGSIVNAMYLYASVRSLSMGYRVIELHRSFAAAYTVCWLCDLVLTVHVST